MNGHGSALPHSAQNAARAGAAVRAGQEEAGGARIGLSGQKNGVGVGGSGAAMRGVMLDTAIWWVGAAAEFEDGRFEEISE